MPSIIRLIVSKEHAHALQHAIAHGPPGYDNRHRNQTGATGLIRRTKGPVPTLVVAIRLQYSEGRQGPWALRGREHFVLQLGIQGRRTNIAPLPWCVKHQALGVSLAESHNA